MKKILILLFFIALSIKAQETKFDLYIVNKGDSFNSIAKKFGMTKKELFELNSYKKNAKLLVGVSLFVRKDKNSNFHLVKKSETLYSISKQHHVTVEKLKQLNRLKSNEIHVGQKLKFK
jgi:LysM repeat protein